MAIGPGTPTVVVTSGEPAGIGPDICARLALGESAARLVFLGDPGVLAQRSRDLDLPVAVEPLEDPAVANPHRAGVMQVLPVTAPEPVTAGRLDPGNAGHVLAQLDLAVQLCTATAGNSYAAGGAGDSNTTGGSDESSARGTWNDPEATETSDAPGATRTSDDTDAARTSDDTDAAGGVDAGRCVLVTAPVQKSVINEAGIAFTGHTEWLAQRTGAAHPVMMLAAAKLRVALATTHLPLSRVAEAITPARLETVLTVLEEGLRLRFGIDSPRILVLGLNPHAGECGVLGREELEIVEPVLRSLSARGLAVSGPAPADTAFTPQRLEACDAVLAMYHDQGLAPIKALAFGETVNVTLGLPFVRTSVDHGTALDLAGRGGASPASLRRAVALAMELRG